MFEADTWRNWFKGDQEGHKRTTADDFRVRPAYLPPSERWGPTFNSTSMTGGTSSQESHVMLAEVVVEPPGAGSGNKSDKSEKKESGVKRKGDDSDQSGGE